MLHVRFRLIPLILLLIGFISSQKAFASPSLFDPPSQVTVHMYGLEYPGGARWTDPNNGSYHLCSSDDTFYGCTFFDEEHYGQNARSYPYATNPVTVSIENDYLLDVVPQEMGTYYHPTAIEAQAIAARTYAYWHINQGSTINDSTQFQVFIPYKFESLIPVTDPDNPTEPCTSSNLNIAQQIVCDAVAPRYFLDAYLIGENPAKTEYFSDIQNRTVDGGEPYLMSVDDPISTACDANDFGHGRGMSQEGASRWARGNRCSYAAQGDNPWSVRWERAEQILVHYYPVASMRDADNISHLPAPYFRWNPLSINWETPDNQPPIMYHEGSYPVTMQVQNTGYLNWTRTTDAFWSLSYHWAKAGLGEIDSSNRDWATVTVPRGDPPYTFTLTINDIPDWGPGAYTLKFDMVFSSTWGTSFWFSSSGQPDWPTYDVGICVDGLCKVFLPVVLKNY